jgi:hypothetical protein
MHKTLANLDISLVPPSTIHCHSRRLLLCNAPHQGGGREEESLPLSEESLPACMELSSLTLYPLLYLSNPERWVPPYPVILTCAQASGYCLCLYNVHCWVTGQHVSALASFTLLENKLDPDSSMQKTLGNLVIALSQPSKMPCHSRRVLL